MHRSPLAINARVKIIPPCRHSFHSTFKTRLRTHQRCTQTIPTKTRSLCRFNIKNQHIYTQYPSYFHTSRPQHDGVDPESMAVTSETGDMDEAGLEEDHEGIRLASSSMEDPWIRNELPPLMVGDFVAVRRPNQSTHFGVIIGIGPAGFPFYPIHLIRPNGKYFSAGPHEIVFILPQWAFSEAVRLDTSPFPHQIRISPEAMNWLEKWQSAEYVEKGVSIPMKIPYNMQQLHAKHQEYYDSRREVFGTVYNVFRKRFAREYATLDEIAAYVFLNKAPKQSENEVQEEEVVDGEESDVEPIQQTQPTPAQVFATYSFIMAHQYLFDASQVRDFARLRRVRLRTIEEVKDIERLGKWQWEYQNAIVRKDDSVLTKSAVGSFITKVKDVLRQSRMADTDAHSSSPSTVAPSEIPAIPTFTSSLPETIPPPYTSSTPTTIKDIEWTSSDKLIITAIFKWILGNSRVPSPYRRFVVHGLFQHLGNDGCFTTKPDFNDYSSMDAQQFLKDIGVLRPWEDMSWNILGNIYDTRNLMGKFEGLPMMMRKCHGKPIEEEKEGEWLLNVVEASNKYAESLVRDVKSGKIDIGMKTEKTPTSLPTPPTPSLSPSTLESFFSALLHVPSHKSMTTKFHDVDQHQHLRHEFHTPVYVIDDPTARELDDGISIEPITSNPTSVSDYWIHVHVADPTALIPANHIISYFAQLRATSHYTPGRHWPMLPEVLSDEIFDLGTSPLALTFSARLDATTGDILDYKVRPSVVRKVKTVYYSWADTFLSWDNVPSYQEFSSDPQTVSPWNNSTLSYKQSSNTNETSFPNIDDSDKSSLRTVQSVVQKHFEYRTRQGACLGDRPEYSVSLDVYPLPLTPSLSYQTNPHFPPKEFYPSIRVNPHSAAHLSPSHLMVAECMIIAGRVASKFCHDRQIPISYRCQDSTYERIDALSKDSSDGYSANMDIGRIEWDHRPFNREHALNVYHDVLEHRNTQNGMIPFVEFQKLLSERLIPPAKQSPIPRKHAAMGLPGIEEFAGQTKSALENKVLGYTKVTSPLRRLTDMITHWQIKAYMLQSQSSNSKSIAYPFDKQALASLMPATRTIERLQNFLSARSNRMWALEWVRRRDAGLKEDDKGYVPPFGRSVGTYNGIGLNDAVSERDRIVYTGYVTSIDERTNLHSLMINEIGGLAARLPNPSKRYEIGDLIPVVAEVVRPDFGIFMVREVL